MTRSQQVIKRSIDLLVVVSTAVLWLPVVVVLALIVWAADGRPVIFTQLRPGVNGRPFRMLKFRTMLEYGVDGDEKADDGKRITPLGRWMRSTSLDELPELWNVITGDMSLVGPRPLLVEYLPLYSPEQARRHEVRPGITGWAQVNGRNAISWEDRLRLDVWYVDNHSALLDLRIMALTICKVVKREDISGIGEATMSKFTGSKS